MNSERFSVTSDPVPVPYCLPKHLHILKELSAQRLELVGEAGIAQTLTGVRRAVSAYDSTIVVVDGNSVDGTVERAKKAGAVVIRQEGRGYGDALFQGFLFGLEELSAKVFLTLDADGTYEPSDAQVT